MEFFKTKHIKREAKLKGKAQQKALDDKYILQLKEVHKKEIEELRKQFNKELQEKELQKREEIAKLQMDHRDNILIIREQEKSYYQPLIKEKNNEIVNLQNDKLDNKKYYESILNYGIMLEDNSVQAMDIFQRAKMRITEFMNYLTSAEKAYGEAMQLIETGKDKIEYTQVQIEKERPKLLKRIKE